MPIANLLLAASLLLPQVNAGVIEGNVRLSNGAPAEGAMVMALGTVFQNGQMKLIPLATSRPGTMAQTDRTGHYRLENIPTTGSFYILAGGGASNREGPTFYPGTSDIKGAKRVSVSAGSPLSSVDFSILKLHGVRVRGDVLGAGASKATVMLTHQVLSMLSQRVAADESGQFEFAGVFAGEYVVWAEAAGVQTPRPFATTTVSVGNEDVRGIDLQFKPVVEVHGRVILDAGASLPVSSQMPGISASIAEGTYRTGASLLRDGTFVLGRMVPGKYWLTLDRLPDDYYVQSISFGSADLLQDPMSVEAPASSEILITLGMGSRVSGIVDAPAARVYLVPRSGARKTNHLTKFVSADAKGEFVFSGVAPGDYTLFAVEQSVMGMEQDPDFLRAHEPKGTPVNVPRDSAGILRVIAQQ